MPERMLHDELGFVDRVWSTPSGKTVNARQLTLDGVPLDEALAAIGVADAGSSPIVEDPRHAPENTTYLRSLLGAPPADSLRAGRIGILFCRHCLDSSCGHLLAAQLDMGEHDVRWSAIGFELEHFATRVGGLFRRRFMPPPEWWTPEPIAPEIVIVFNRAHYFRCLEDELSRLTR